MAEGSLNTTNILLGIMAAVSVLQAFVVIGVAVFAFRLYRRAMRTIEGIEERHIVPIKLQISALIARIDGIAGDVKAVSGRVSRQTERVDLAIHDTIHRVDETAERVRDSIGARIYQLMGLVHGVSRAVQSLFNGRRASTEASAT